MPRLLLLALLPFLPFVVAVLTYAPLRGEHVVALTGPWQVVEPAEGEDVKLPGPLPRDVERVRLKKTFSLDAVSEPFAIVFGGLSSGVAELRLNGHWLGAEGVVSDGYKLGQVSLALYPVAPDRLVAGDNVLEVVAQREGKWSRAPRFSVVDQRLLLGPADAVRPWFDRASLLDHLLEQGGVLLLLFVTLLVLALSAAEKDRHAREIQWAAAALCGAIVVYLSGKSGVASAVGLGRDVLGVAVCALGAALPELVERAFLPKTTSFVRVNRVLCAVQLVAQAFSPPLAYRVFIPWLFVIMLYGVFLAVRGVARSRNAESALLAGSIVAMVVAGINDMLTDLSLVATPRLFTLASVDMAVLGSVFVVSRFLRAMSENQRLVVSLQTALEKAEESTRLKSAFLANTSHELRTPLNSIINVPEGLLEEFVQKPFLVCSSCASLFEAPEGYSVKPGEKCPECSSTDTLQTELRAVFTGDPDAAMRYLRSIQQSGRHLLAVVTDILDFSKLEAGKMVLHVEDTSLDDILEKLALAMTPLAETRRITLKVTRVDKSEKLDADAVKLTQVLMNLVSNAIKFSPEEADVVVDVRLEKAAGAAEERVVFSVVDKGIGIADADQQRIFESFLQIDNTHTRKVGGTGLGLTITKNLVELMGGTLSLRSKPGEGSTFTVDIPRRRS